MLRCDLCADNPSTLYNDVLVDGCYTIRAAHIASKDSPLAVLHLNTLRECCIDTIADVETLRTFVACEMLLRISTPFETQQRCLAENMQGVVDAYPEVLAARARWKELHAKVLNHCKAANAMGIVELESVAETMKPMSCNDAARIVDFGDEEVVRIIDVCDYGNVVRAVDVKLWMIFELKNVSNEQPSTIHNTDDWQRFSHLGNINNEEVLHIMQEYSLEDLLNATMVRARRFVAQFGISELQKKLLNVENYMIEEKFCMILDADIKLPITTLDDYMHVHARWPPVNSCEIEQRSDLASPYDSLAEFSITIHLNNVGSDDELNDLLRSKHCRATEFMKFRRLLYTTDDNDVAALSDDEVLQLENDDAFRMKYKFAGIYYELTFRYWADLPDVESIREEALRAFEHDDPRNDAEFRSVRRVAAILHSRFT